MFFSISMLAPINWMLRIKELVPFPTGWRIIPQNSNNYKTMPTCVTVGFYCNASTLSVFAIKTTFVAITIVIVF